MAYEIIQYRRWALGIPVSATESNFIEILTPTFICALVALVVRPIALSSNSLCHDWALIQFSPLRGAILTTGNLPDGNHCPHCT